MSNVTYLNNYKEHRALLGKIGHDILELTHVYGDSEIGCQLHLVIAHICLASTLIKKEEL